MMTSTRSSLFALVLLGLALSTPAIAQEAEGPAPQEQVEAEPALVAPDATTPVAAPEATAQALPQPAAGEEGQLPDPVPAQSAPAGPVTDSPTTTPATDTTAAPVQIASETLPHDLSPWGMFMQADWIVKGVMVGLALAALVTWTIWLAKGLEVMGAKARARFALKAITRSRTLDDAVRALDGRRGAGVLLVRAAEEEVGLSLAALAHSGGTGLKERVSSRVGRLTAASGRRLSRGTGVLATIGSVSPFVGLFGTVWGIMNAFIGISEAQTTNLAVVAPGIAEALLATALGLVAAIPAVIIYNVFARSVTGYRALLADAAAGVERLVSRDLDHRNVPAPTSLRHPGLAATETR